MVETHCWIYGDIIPHFSKFLSLDYLTEHIQKVTGDYTLRVTLIKSDKDERLEGILLASPNAKTLVKVKPFYYGV